jgi:hypothetical protein
VLEERALIAEPIFKVAFVPSDAAEVPELLASRPPPEFNWRDYTTMLLHVAAEIEHSLMVQYLFAAYSLGGPQVPPELRADVRAWQETILGIAKEEMGHLVTVQNLLTAFRAPLNLDREDYPWGTDFYPFEFSLQRLTLDSLATYVCAESPADWEGPEADAIRERAAGEAGAPVNRVGALYELLTGILGDRDRIPDTAFNAATVPHQASWDEWGRGYREGQRGQEGSNVPGVPAPDLLILQVSSRDTAVGAIAEIGEQGEAVGAIGSTDPGDAGEESHFRRFLAVYEAIEKLDGPTQGLVSRAVMENPSTSTIEDDTARLWAHLFNLRYRMLLVDLAHAFELAEAPGLPTSATARGALVNRTFTEMYNLRAIAGALVDLPASGDGETRAGPPFEMPYSLELPPHEHDRWLLHRDLLQAAAALIESLEPVASAQGVAYLTALAESDALVLEQVERMAR